MIKVLLMVFAVIVSFIIVVLFVVSATIAAQAQGQGHARHHATYKSWINKNDVGCCNDKDCNVLAEEDERTTASGGVEVRVEGVWCPVLSFHYLKKGNAPDWSTSHVCVVAGAAVPVCTRLRCYQPKPGI